jgi:hypothetical protein
MHSMVCFYNSEVILAIFLVVVKVDDIISKVNINKNFLNLLYL